jgi:PAS domain S-box-containing protein
MIARKTLEQFIEQAPVAIGMFDREMRLLAASQRWLGDPSLAADALAGRNAPEPLRRFPQGWKALRDRALTGECLGPEEHAISGDDGSVSWWRWEMQPWFTSRGEVGGVVVSTEDVTSRRRAEQAAHESLARVRAVLETTSDAIVTFDRAGLITDANAATRSLFGYVPTELLGRDVRMLFPAPSPDRAERYIDHCLRGDDARIVGSAIETEALRADGTTLAVELSIGEIDHLAMFTASIRDVSKRKKAEQALLDSHAELERRVEDRTHALQAAKQEAERANAFKTRFLAAASHDLRQPLQSLGMYLSVLARQLTEPQQRAICDKMQQSRDAVAHILEALLDVSKLESGTVRPEKQEFALQPMLERIVADNLPQAEAKGLRLSASPTDCTVRSDPALLERVVENLVTNAIRYTEHGHVTIVCERASANARIAVSDSGVGIEPAALDKIFDEYYQVSNEARDRRKGLGLGLSIVKHIARLLDHEIEVRSVPGEGSTFTVSVPLTADAAAVADVRTAGGAASAHRREPVVLLIDDEPAIVDATTLLLQSAGLTVHAAGSGEAARELLAAGVRPDMVVCDYRLPGANGVKVIRSLRELVKTEVPAILLTGDTSGGEIEHANVPRCVVLHKPVDADRLIDVIETSLHAHGP